MYLFSPQIPEKEAQEEIVKANDVIKELGGKIEKEEYWGLKDLAYEIKKYKQGYYHINWFTLNKEEVDSLKKKLKSIPPLLRFLITTFVEGQEIIIPQEKTEGSLEQVSATLQPQIGTKKAISRPPKETPSQKKKSSKTSKKPKAEMEDLDKKLEEILKEEVL